MPTPRSQFGAALVDGEIYTVGGLTKPPGGRFVASPAVESFDPVVARWRRLTDLPSPRHHLMTAAYDGRLFVFGGYDGDAGDPGSPTDEAWRYDPRVGRWEPIAPLPHGSAAGMAVVVGDGIFIVGGVPRGRSVYRYDPGRDAWETMAPMAEPAEHLAAVLLDGRIHAIGGRWRGQELASLAVYDSTADAWRELPALHTARSGFEAAVWGSRIIAMGGEIVGTRETLASVEVFDPATGAWSYASPLPIPLEGHRAAIVDGALYLIGGLPPPDHADDFGVSWRLELVAP